MSELRSLATLDDAIELLRGESPGSLLLCVSPALGMTWLALFAYYLERVEGVHSLRPLLALGFVLLWAARALLLGRFAGRTVQRLLTPLLAEAPHGPPGSLLGAGLVLGGELWLWSWLLLAALRVSPWAILGTLPLLALRGALAPSWLAACDALPAGGPLHAAWHALHSADRQRLTGLGSELLMLLGAVALFFNVGALLAAVVSLSQDLLGLPLSFVRAFISPGNHFALLALAGCSLSAFEPLRACHAAVLWVESRERREALALQALVRACIAQGASKLLLASLLAMSCAAARADDVIPARTDSEETLMLPEQECDEGCLQARARDDALLVKLVTLLEDDSFREFPDDSWSPVGGQQQDFVGWLRAFLRWLSGDSEQGKEQPAAPYAERPLARAVLVGALALLTGLVASVLGRLLWRTRRKARPTQERQAPGAGSPASDLSEVLTREPDLSRALRALYLSSLSVLARRGLLQLAGERCNGDYVRSLPAGSEREALAELTERFDRSYYGALPPTPPELARAHTLARRLIEGSGAP